jgi:hypothetical protein
MLDGQPEDVATAVVADLERTFEPHVVDGVVTLGYSTWIVSALR